MRVIKFRGLSVIDNRQWVYGSCQKLDALKYPGIIEPKRGGKCYEVLPETVGQYTGLKDRNEVEIYEGDIVVNPETEKGYVVEFVDGCFTFRRNNLHYSYANIVIIDLYEVIGNIHQNPELLNQE